ncbi:MAG: ATP-binding protein, partial [Cryobacterium sp.]|nr:ATP-binding protein [Cryobacterium sp.]
MANYRARVIEGELSDRMKAIGAVLIDGPKAVGKTSTAVRAGASIWRMDVDTAARAALETHP